MLRTRDQRARSTTEWACASRHDCLMHRYRSAILTLGLSGTACQISELIVQVNKHHFAVMHHFEVD